MIRQLLALALLYGFWLPPLVAGLWMAGRRQRVLNLPFAVVGWSLIWVVSLYLLFPSYVPKPKGPTDHYFLRGLLLVACLFTFATVVVLPVSAIACWIGTLRGTLAGDKLKFGLSLIIFALIQLLFVLFLLAR
jgi:hypothetical protein